MMQSLETSLHFDKILSDEEIAKIEMFGTNLFGGRKNCYVELKQNQGTNYNLIVCFAEE